MLFVCGVSYCLHMPRIWNVSEKNLFSLQINISWPLLQNITIRSWYGKLLCRKCHWLSSHQPLPGILGKYGFAAVEYCWHSEAKASVHGASNKLGDSDWLSEWLIDWVCDFSPWARSATEVATETKFGTTIAYWVRMIPERWIHA